MNIKTKFNIGDKVWTIINFRAVEIEVAAILCSADGICIRGLDEYTWIREENCFYSKELLIKYLSDGC